MAAQPQLLAADVGAERRARRHGARSLCPAKEVFFSLDDTKRKVSFCFVLFVVAVVVAAVVAAATAVVAAATAVVTSVVVVVVVALFSCYCC